MKTPVLRRPAATLAAVASTVVLAGLAPATTAGAVTPTSAPPGVTMRAVALTGGGCPTGSAAVGVGDDPGALTVTYANFLVATTPSSTSTVSSQNCQATFRVNNLPQGYTYSVKLLESRGSANLAAGDSASVLSGYSFQDMPSMAGNTHTLTGPRSMGFQVKDMFLSSDQVWMPCDDPRDLTINTDLQIIGGSDTGTRYAALNWTDVQLQWALC